MKIAVIADIHGNLPALETVADDIAQRQISHVFNLGDHASGPLWPMETVTFLMAQAWLQIAGNCERQVTHHAPATQAASDRYAFDHLTEAQRSWLGGLPKTLVADPSILLSHGTPSDDNTYLLETIEHGKVRLATQSEISARLANVPQTLVLCAHSHIPRVAMTTNGMTIVNPGSVGLPAYDSDHPEPHIMETGSPHARYAILSKANSAARWQIELIHVAYDHLAAAAQAQRNGRDDWAAALRNGYV